jgi:hypothetical protein
VDRALLVVTRAMRSHVNDASRVSQDRRGCLVDLQERPPLSAVTQPGSGRYAALRCICRRANPVTSMCIRVKDTHSLHDVGAVQPHLLRSNGNSWTRALLGVARGGRVGERRQRLSSDGHPKHEAEHRRQLTGLRPPRVAFVPAPLIKIGAGRVCGLRVTAGCRSDHLRLPAMEARPS